MNSTKCIPLHYLSLQYYPVEDRNELFIALHLLLGEKAINSQNIRGETPFHYAAMGSASPEVVAFLLTHGGDLMTSDNSGQSPFDILQHRNHRDALDVVSYENMLKNRVTLGHSFINTLSEWSLMGVNQLVERISSNANGDVGIDAAEILIPLHQLYDQLFADISADISSPKSTISCQFDHNLHLYKLACTYPLLATLNAAPSSIFVRFSDSIWISSRNQFFDALYYPGWADVVIRSLLLVHSKFFGTKELFERLISDCRKYAFLIRVVYLWVRDHFESTLICHEACLQSIKRLLDILEEKSSLLSPLEERVRLLLQKVSIAFNVFYKFS